ncbi:hypothetical protein METHPM2_720013 [Pseudomonas sp. PM2]
MGAMTSMTRTVSTLGHPACLGEKLSLAMRSPHFIREFALLLPALSLRLGEFQLPSQTEFLFR